VNELVAAHDCLVWGDEGGGDGGGVGVGLGCRLNVCRRCGPFDHVRLELCEAEGEPERDFNVPLCGWGGGLNQAVGMLVCYEIIFENLDTVVQIKEGRTYHSKRQLHVPKPLGICSSN